MKKKGASIFALWEKAAKAKKTASTSTLWEKAAFYLVCYLFKDRTKCHGGDTFVNGGWRNWNLKSRLKKHMGAINSAHNEAQEKYDRFTTPTTSIRESIASNTTQYKALYKLRLTWTLKCLRFLLHQGLAFRGHDESEESLNKGNFLELLNWLAGNFEEVDKVVLNNAPQNYKMICHETHQLQLTLVDVAKESGDCTWFFGQLAILLNVLGNSCKKMRMLRIAQAEELIDGLDLEEVETGRGLNQEMGLGRPCDTRWGSHYKTVNHVISMYPAIRRVLIKIGKEYTTAEAQAAMTMLTSFRSFEFVFMAHLMQEIFGYTDDLSRALQKKDQDIVNAMELVDLTKFHLQYLRKDSGWTGFLEKVTSFCIKHKIKVADMEGPYYPVGRPKRGFYNGAINYHRYHVDMFVSIIDRQLGELNDRFDEVRVAQELAFCIFWDHAPRDIW